jgi:hypothetical protein
MRTTVSCLALLSALAAPAAAQSPPEAQRAEMKNMDFLLGEWDGTGWVELRPGQRQPFTIHESAQSKLDGLALLLEGLGKSRTPEGKERITHHALATVAYDQQARGYRISAYRVGGGFVSGDVRVAGTTMTWGFTDPRAGEIRFTIVVDGKGQWDESGEASRDGGKSWHPFLHMTLHRR